ncbi:GntR family transcriptional regulator [Oceanibacterium hippocampi]|uniref:Putative HTH-type transcriptional regulator YdfH n=1 Tax=Oceanibacterium hippocampi TaxID=745714 RepID=A0A1Y5U049_9PROT|nr:GntR family transcriptional regulator [Oceanibacterium hippocampi]SLN77703.1 putative HTH-type transcriptional regulator YdfH [Oceanibacterium hippocampi]
MIETTYPSLATDRAGTQSVGDQITGQLRSAIVHAELLPGTRLKQEELAVRYGTSRIPLREAMRQLTAEGLIQWTSNRSAVVSFLEIDELHELFELVRLLESRGTLLGVPHLSDDDIAELDELNRQVESGPTEPRSWYFTNLNFHMLPIVRSNQKHTIRMVTELRANLMRFFMIPDLYRAPNGSWYREHAAGHRKLLAAFRRRDAVEASALVDADWAGAWDYWKPRLSGVVSNLVRPARRSRRT